MFDLLRGIAITLVLVKHSIHTDAESLMFWRFAYMVLMPVFFMISGYWLKEKTVLTGIKSGLQSFLKPYVISMIVINMVGFVHRLSEHKLDEWFSLFLTPSVLVYSGENSRIGAMWFVFALMGAWILFYFLIQIKNQWLLCTACLSIGTAGYFLLDLHLPFQIAQAMIAQVFVYSGYLLKKRKLLEKSLKIWQLLLLGGIWLITGLVFCRNNVCDLATYHFGDSPLVIPGCICGCFLIIYIGIRINAVENPVFDKLSQAGRYTMWILCIHSIEAAVVPWKYLFKIVPEYSLAGTLLQLLCRTLMIIGGCMLLKTKNMLKIRNVPLIKNMPLIKNILKI